MLNKIKITNRASGITENIIVESLHNRAIFFKIESIKLIFKAGPILRSDFLDYLYILVRMESGQSLLFRVHVVDFSEIIVLRLEKEYDFIEVVVQLVFFDNFISHSDSQWFHGVVDCVVVGADHSIEIINHILLVIHVTNYLIIN